MPNRSHPTTSTTTGVFSATYPLTHTPVRAACQVLAPSDFGVEIGAAPSFEKLPRTLRQSAGRIARKICVGCHQHRALFRYRGKVRFRRDHNLCQRCYRSVMDRIIGRSLALSRTKEVPTW